MDKYDYIILGSGPAAMHLLFRLKGTSNKILVIEKGYWGGTCPNTGCQPKIFMEGTVRPVLNSYYLVGKGVKAAAEIDWPSLMTRKKKIWASYHTSQRDKVTSEMIDTVQGKGVIIDPHTVKVDDREYEGQHIVIATGESPRMLDVPGGQYAITNNKFFDLEQLPTQAVVIGGGYIALELATILQAAGTQVTILQHSDRLLRPFDQELVNKLKYLMEERGIAFHMNAPIKEITKKDNHYTVTTISNRNFDTNLVINATGRKPNVEGIGLEKVGVAFDPDKGVTVNQHLQTTVPSIFAAGDVANNGQPNLTPVAWVDAYHIADFVEQKTNLPVKYPVIATSSFTYPEIAQAGIREDEMKKGDYVRSFNLGNSFAALGEGDTEATLKVIFNDEGEVVGVSELSINASDDINNFVPLIGKKNPTKYVEDHLGVAFPTLATKLDSIFR